MSATASQVMRVLDRCLDTAETDHGYAPDVAAAAAKAKTDPGIHQALTLLLADEDRIVSSNCSRMIMTAASEAQSGTGTEDGPSPSAILMLRFVADGDRATASEAAAMDIVPDAGEGEADCVCGHPIADIEECDSAAPAIQVLSSCLTASPADTRAAVILAGLLLSAAMVEKSSLGTDRSRRLRNLAAHGDITAVLSRWRNLPDH